MPQVIPAAIAAFQAAVTATVAVATTATLAVTGSAAAALAVSNFVAGALTLGAAGGGIAGFLGATAGMSAISSALTPKPKMSTASTQLQTKVGAVTPRAVAMGRTAVAGTLLTPTPLKSGRGNALATNFYALSHAGPSGVVDSILWGDDVVTFDAQGQAIGKYANNMWLYQKSGSWSQSSITFAGTPGISADTPSAWDSTKKGAGCLMAGLVVRYAASVIANNLQTPMFVVDANAVQLTDPRTGLLATTTAQRRNPAVWAYSWRLGWFQNSRRIIGIGQPASELHAAGYAYAANVADANGWVISGEGSTADDRYAVEVAILQACASVPVERNGLQSVVTSALRSSVGTITSNDLRADPKWRYNTQQSSRPTSVQTRFRSEGNRWQMVEGAEVTDASWVTQDAGREKRVTVEYVYAGGGSAHVGHLAALDASNAREPLVFMLPCKQQARYAGFVGDAVTVSLPEIGLASTKMVILSRVVNTDGTVDYELLVETDAKYAFAAGKTSVAPSFTLQPGFDIYNVPQPVLADWASVAAQITSGATSLPIVRVTGSAANYDFASGVVFKIRLNSVGSPWLVSEDAPPAASQHEFRGLTNATSYIVGVAYRGVTGVEGPVRELAAVTTGVMVAGSAGAVAPGAVRIGTDIYPPGNSVTALPGFELLNSANGIGGNMTVNSDLTTDTAGFFAAGYNNLSGTGLVVEGARNAGGYFGHANSVYTRASVSSGSLTGSYLFGWAQKGFGGDLADLRRYALPVKHNDRVWAAARISVHSLLDAVCRVRFWDRNGIFVAEYDARVSNVDARLGGPSGADGDPANYTLVGQFWDVPPNSAFAVICPYGDQLRPSQPDCWVFAIQYHLTRVPAGQTVPPPYVPGPSDRVADRTGENTAAGFMGQGTEASVNRYRQNTAPTSPLEGDYWYNTSTVPVTINRLVSGQWAFHAQEGADITAASQRVIVPQFPVIEIRQGEPGHTGSRTVTHTVKRGLTTLSGGASSLPAFNLGTGSATVNATSGAVTLSGIVQSGSYTYRYTHTDGFSTELAVNVTYVPTPASGSVAKRPTPDINSNGTDLNNSWQTIATVTINGCPTGNLFFDGSFFFPGSGTGNCDHKARITIDGALAGSELASQNTISGGSPVVADFSELFAQVLAVSAGNRTIAFQLQRTFGTGKINNSSTRLDVSAFPT